MGLLETKYLYFILMVFSLSYPLAQSFEWRIKLYTKWKRIFWATLAILIIFVPWDAYFTELGVWNFNPIYILGLKIIGLPIEEWLFFIIIPYCCVFIYEVLNYFFPKNFLEGKEAYFLIPYGIALLILWVLHLGKWYPTVTFLLTIGSIVHLLIAKPKWSADFVRAYLVIFIPFLLINGALTGSFTQEAVVRYDPNEFMGFRIFTIPFEDSVYNFLMVWLLIFVYERTA